MRAAVVAAQLDEARRWAVVNADQLPGTFRPHRDCWTANQIPAGQMAGDQSDLTVYVLGDADRLSTGEQKARNRQCLNVLRLRGATVNEGLM